jgi:hypothetical protein
VLCGEKGKKMPDTKDTLTTIETVGVPVDGDLALVCVVVSSGHIKGTRDIFVHKREIDKILCLRNAVMSAALKIEEIEKGLPSMCWLSIPDE